MDDVSEETIQRELESEEERPNCMTAFTVVIHENGRAQAVFGESDREWIIQRAPTLDDFRVACSEVSADLTMHQTAQLAVNMQMMVAQQMREAVVNNQIVQGMKGDPRLGPRDGRGIIRP